MSPAEVSENNCAQQGNTTELQCRLVSRDLHELLPHPSYVRHRFSVPATQLSALAAIGDLAFRLPVIITSKGIIIDGYARCALARRQGRQRILCLEYDLSDKEVLRWLTQTHRPSRGLNGFSRSLLALDLKTSLREASRENQRIGGQLKGSSNLTEAQKLDARLETAAVAGISTGNLTKAEQVSKRAPEAIQRAVRAGEVSVHKAWQWRGLSPQQQLESLEEYRSRKGTNQKSRRLIQRHVARLSPTRLIPPSLTDLLKPWIPDRLDVLDSIVLAEIDAPGRIAYFTRDAVGPLRSREAQK